MKDAVVIPECGAEMIPFLKVWALLPMAVLLTYAFTKLSSKFSQERVFYIVISAFLGFYLVFALFLYPSRDLLHPHSLAHKVRELLGPELKGLIGLFEYWTFTLFYVLAELWSSIVMAVLFWGFANEVTKFQEAKRFYAMLTVGANLSSFVAGQTANWIAKNSHFFALPVRGTGYEQTVILQISLITLFGILAMYIYYRLNRNLLDKPEYQTLHTAGGLGKTKKRLSIRKSLLYLKNSPYLASIASIVVAYNVVINLVEVIWKDQLSLMYPNPSDYAWYLNNLTSATGIFSACIAFVMAHIISRYGWTVSAMITPVIVGVTGAGFFTFLFLGDLLGGFMLSVVGLTPLTLIALFGGAQNVFSKAAKYSLFDATKEMAFIPLDHESKLRGKAAIDGIGSRFGKSGGSLIHQTLLISFGSLSLSAPIVAAIAGIVLFFWITTLRFLGKEFLTLTEEQESPVEEPLLTTG